MPRPIEALIHTAALAGNLARARAAPRDARVWAVVKGHAYGHGIERAYAGLRGADGFALLDLAEAERVRKLGWRGPVLLLEGCFEPRDLELCSRLGLWHVVHCTEQIDWLASHKTHQPHRVFLKMNSGMNRLGFVPAAFRAAWARLNALTQVDEISLMTHFSDADGERGVAHQVAAFDAATRDLPGERSLSNSAAVLRHGLANDWVRAGILCYGSAPDFPAHDIHHWGLQPTMTLPLLPAGRTRGGTGVKAAARSSSLTAPSRLCGAKTERCTGPSKNGHDQFSPPSFVLLSRLRASDSSTVRSSGSPISRKLSPSSIGMGLSEGGALAGLLAGGGLTAP